MDWCPSRAASSECLLRLCRFTKCDNLRRSFLTEDFLRLSPASHRRKVDSQPRRIPTGAATLAPCRPGHSPPHVGTRPDRALSPRSRPLSAAAATRRRDGPGRPSGVGSYAKVRGPMPSGLISSWSSSTSSASSTPRPNWPAPLTTSALLSVASYVARRDRAQSPSRSAAGRRCHQPPGRGSTGLTWSGCKASFPILT